MLEAEERDGMIGSWWQEWNPIGFTLRMGDDRFFFKDFFSFDLDL